MANDQGSQVITTDNMSNSENSENAVDPSDTGGNRANDVNGPRRYFILIDATLESQAPIFDENPIFQSWLRCYNNIPNALEFVSKIKLPYSIQIYIARDDISDDGIPSDTNGGTRTLLDTFHDLQTIDHVSVFYPSVDTELEQQIRSIIPNPRLIRDVISVVNLGVYICNQGISYFMEEIARCISINEIHLIENLRRSIDELMKYIEKVMNDRKKLLDALEEEYSNKSGEEPK